MRKVITIAREFGAGGGEIGRKVAKELGILEAGWKAVTGAEIDQLSDEELERRIEEYAVYARVQPEHKATRWMVSRGRKET